MYLQNKRKTNFFAVFNENVINVFSSLKSNNNNNTLKYKYFFK